MDHDEYTPDQEHYTDPGPAISWPVAFIIVGLAMTIGATCVGLAAVIGLGG